MKKRLLSLLALVAIAMTGCSEDEPTDPNPGPDPGPEPGVVIKDLAITVKGGKAEWKEGDQIGVITQDNKTLAFTLKEAGKNEGEAVFEYNSDYSVEGLEVVRAFYPYSAKRIFSIPTEAAKLENQEDIVHFYIGTPSVANENGIIVDFEPALNTVELSLSNIDDSYFKDKLVTSVTITSTGADRFGNYSYEKEGLVAIKGETGKTYSINLGDGVAIDKDFKAYIPALASASEQEFTLAFKFAQKHELNDVVVTAKSAVEKNAENITIDIADAFPKYAPSVTIKGDLTWSAGDQIGVITTEGIKAFNYVESNDKGSVFSYENPNKIFEIQGAFYPYTAGKSFEIPTVSDGSAAAESFTHFYSGTSSLSGKDVEVTLEQKTAVLNLSLSNAASTLYKDKHLKKLTVKSTAKRFGTLDDAYQPTADVLTIDLGEGVAFNNDFNFNVLVYAAAASDLKVGFEFAEYLPLVQMNAEVAISAASANEGSTEKLSLDAAKLPELSTMFNGGSGADGNPYLICNAEQIQRMKDVLVSGKTVYFALDADVDMTGIKDWKGLNARNNFPYRIVFDGKGHTISNFYCEDDTYPGFFGMLWGECRNVRFENALVKTPTNSSSAGILGGYIGTGGKPAIVENCYVHGTVNYNGTSANPFGGIGGYVREGTLRNNYVDVILRYTNGHRTLNSGVGGLCGETKGDLGTGTNNIIENNFVTADIKVTTHNAGGISGRVIRAKTKFQNNIFWADAISGRVAVGTVVGRWTDNNQSEMVLGANYAKKGIVITTYKDNGTDTQGLYNPGNKGDGCVLGTETDNASSAAKSMNWNESIWDLSGETPQLKMFK